MTKLWVLPINEITEVVRSNIVTMSLAKPRVLLITEQSKHKTHGFVKYEITEQSPGFRDIYKTLGFVTKP